MPARIIEELASRKKEKIAAFLTFESIVAVVLAFLPLFIISAQWPLITRVPLCLLAALAGYICTVEVRGLPLYEHAIWSVRGLARLRLHGNRIGPDDLPGAVPAPVEDRVIVISDAISLVEREASGSQPARSGRLATTASGQEAREKREPEDDRVPNASHEGNLTEAGMMLSSGEGVAALPQE